MITIITPTGGRPEAFALLNGYMLRQTYEGPVRWIIVDDFHPRTDFPKVVRDWKITVIRPTKVWEPGQNSQAPNLLAGLASMLDDSDRLLIMEDDDWYSPRYLEIMNNWLNDCLLVGEGFARYYNVRSRMARQLGNSGHASLCSTGMRGAAIQTFVEVVQDAIKSGSSYLDIDLWERRQGSVRANQGLSVGMKGLPGRPGIGMGHVEHMIAQGGMPDPAGEILRGWVGTDAEAYLELAQ